MEKFRTRQNDGRRAFVDVLLNAHRSPRVELAVCRVNVVNGRIECTVNHIGSVDVSLYNLWIEADNERLEVYRAIKFDNDSHATVEIMAELN